jgi:hypothetical protein
MIGRAFSSSLVVFFVVFAGCNDEPKNGDGVNDVRQACEIRAKFVRVNNKCGLCEASVVAPRCECVELKDFSAACIEQADKRKGVCNDAIDTCVNTCKADDCNCIDNCYAADANCRSASGARDGCIAEACADYCK